jgi:Domain of unknown function (DUF5979)
MRFRNGSKSFAIVAAVPLLLGSLVYVAAVAGGLTPPDPNVVVDKVEICHRTNANTHPYEINEPAADGDVSGHADHTGPVWNETLKAQHIVWGDIIPPFKFEDNTGEHDFPGLNWDAEGQAIFENDCEPVEPPEQEFGSLTVTKTVVGPDGTPTGTLPTGFTVHVECDDLVTSVDVTFPASGGAGTPATIDDIEAGSTCIVTELNTGTFPPGTIVGYTPVGANTTGVVVDADENVAVNVTNTFAAVAPALQAQPAFTG